MRCASDIQFIGKSIDASIWNPLVNSLINVMIFATPGEIIVHRSDTMISNVDRTMIMSSHDDLAC